MPNFKTEFYLKLIFLINSIAIISALFIEYILGHLPCNLCLIERIPHILSIVVLIIFYKLKKKEKYFILLLTLIFIFSLIISIYHFGIEQGFIKESAICNLKDGADILSKEDLLLELQTKIVSCKDVTFRIFGLSLTTYNMIISVIMFLISVKIYLINNDIKK